MINLSFVIALVVKATLILVVAWGLSLPLRRSSAAARQLTWTVALSAILLLPAVSIAVPPVRPKVTMATTAVFEGPASIAEEAPAVRKFPWMRAMTGLYMAGVAWVLGRVALGSARVALLARESRPFPKPVVSPVSVLITDQLALPVTWGFFRPVILLPMAAQEWPPDRLRLVIAHEAAHIRRWDFPGQVAAQLACALYWFHPLAWWAFEQLIREREQACDDEVLNMGVKGTEYADHLLHIIRSANQAGTVWSPAIGMAQPTVFERRLQAMLDTQLNRRAPSRRICAVSALLAAILLLPLAAVRLPSQTTTAFIEGTVRDPSGAVIPFTRILLKNLDGSNVEAPYSGADGSYHLSGIQPGRYSFEVMSPGFEAFRQAEIQLTPGSAVNLDVQMNVGAAHEAVEVLGTRPAHAAPLTGRAPQRIRVGGNVQATKLLNKVQPVYPESALEKGLEGTVLLRAVIGTDGKLLSLGAVSAASDPDLTKAALNAVQLWTYEPTLLNAQPVEVVTTISVTFRLQ